MRMIWCRLLLLTPLLLLCFDDGPVCTQGDARCVSLLQSATLGRTLQAPPLEDAESLPLSERLEQNPADMLTSSVHDTHVGTALQQAAEQLEYSTQAVHQAQVDSKAAEAKLLDLGERFKNGSTLSHRKNMSTRSHRKRVLHDLSAALKSRTALLQETLIPQAASLMQRAKRAASGLELGSLALIFMLLATIVATAVFFISPNASRRFGGNQNRRSAAPTAARVLAPTRSRPANNEFAKPSLLSMLPRGSADLGSVSLLPARSNSQLIAQTPPAGAPRAVLAPSAEQLPTGERHHEYFCPDLVVPDQQECVLAVPLSPPSAGISVDVRDTHGNAVLRFQESRLMQRTGSRARMRRLQLLAPDGVLLAHCTAGPQPGELRLERPDERCFARLAAAAEAPQERFLLEAPGESYTLVRAQDSGTDVKFTILDKERRPVAVTEPFVAPFDRSVRYFRVRVAPLMDVGLVLCSLLGITHLGELIGRSDLSRCSDRRSLESVKS